MRKSKETKAAIESATKSIENVGRLRPKFQGRDNAIAQLDRIYKRRATALKILNK